MPSPGSGVTQPDIHPFLVHQLGRFGCCAICTTFTPSRSVLTALCSGPWLTGNPAAALLASWGAQDRSSCPTPSLGRSAEQVNIKKRVHNPCKQQRLDQFWSCRMYSAALRKLHSVLDNIASFFFWSMFVKVVSSYDWLTIRQHVFVEWFYLQSSAIIFLTIV